MRHYFSKKNEANTFISISRGWLESGTEEFLFYRKVKTEVVLSFLHMLLTWILTSPIFSLIIMYNILFLLHNKGSYAKTPAILVTINTFLKRLKTCIFQSRYNMYTYYGCALHSCSSLLVIVRFAHG